MLSTSEATRGRPDALGDVPGTPDLALTRSVILYWDRQVIGASQPHVDDIGVGLVLEGRYAASTSVLDLGSTRLRELDLSRELAVLGWVRSETLAHVLDLLAAQQGAPDLISRPDQRVGPYCFGLGLRVLAGLGFSAATRPAFLRIGFRDLRRDFDPDGRRGIRVDLGEQGIASFELDVDDLTLRIRLDRARDASLLETALNRSFPGLTVRRAGMLQRASTVLYEARVPLPRSVNETRELMRTLRAGLIRLVARFEPARYEELARSLEIFGHRDTLLRFHPATTASAVMLEPVVTVEPSLTVH
ncbi:MAG: hypothetical protein R3E10_14470 [Gemmatimonadota bacterium]